MAAESSSWNASNADIIVRVTTAALAHHCTTAALTIPLSLPLPQVEDASHMQSARLIPIADSTIATVLGSAPPRSLE